MRNLLSTEERRGERNCSTSAVRFRRDFRFTEMIVVGEPLNAESIVIYLEKSQKMGELMGNMLLVIDSSLKV